MYAAKPNLQAGIFGDRKSHRRKSFSGATHCCRLSRQSFAAFLRQAQLRSRCAATKVDTMYDIASLTKVVVTTTLVEKLVEGDFASPLNLDAPIDRYLPPEWDNLRSPDNAPGLAPQSHRAESDDPHFGIASFKEYWRTSKSKSETLSRIFVEPLEYEPGTKVVYSDLGIILMAEIIQRLTGQPLERLAHDYIFGPLGMQNSMYLPPKNLWPEIAPTEVDNQLRHRLVQGEVHDENAFAIGGVSGHAGVFSTSPDLAAFCQMLLNGGVYAHHRILKRATIAEFTVPQALAKNTRTLGWVVPTEGSSSGHYFSAHSYGHTGFTGTTIWIDPDRQLFVVLLDQSRQPHARKPQDRRSSACRPRCRASKALDWSK